MLYLSPSSTSHGTIIVLTKTETKASLAKFGCIEHVADPRVDAVFIHATVGIRFRGADEQGSAPSEAEHRSIH